MDEAVILTREGLENLKEELVNLKTVRRKERHRHRKKIK